MAASTAPGGPGGRGAHHTGLHLHTAATPSGWKASVVAEELGLSYTVHKIDLLANEQKSPAYLKINPAGRIPALVDYDVEGGLTLTESGAIMAYLADAKDPEHRLLPTSPARRAEVLSWVLFQADHMASATRAVVLALAFGVPASQESVAAAAGELQEAYKLLEKRLEATGLWLTGGALSIADIACLGSVLWPARLLKVDLQARYPHLAKWLQRMLARPGVRRGLDVPQPCPVALDEQGQASGQCSGPVEGGDAAEVAKAQARLAKLGLETGTAAGRE